MLFVLFGDLLAEQRWSYLVSYLSVPIGISAAQVFLFWWGNPCPALTHLFKLRDDLVVLVADRRGRRNSFSFSGGAGSAVLFFPTGSSGASVGDKDDLSGSILIQFCADLGNFARRAAT